MAYGYFTDLTNYPGGGTWGQYPVNNELYPITVPGYSGPDMDNTYLFGGASYQYNPQTGAAVYMPSPGGPYPIQVGPGGSVGTYVPPGGEGESEGEGEGEGGMEYGTMDFPPATYLPSPTDEEMAFMSKFGIEGYSPWASGVIDQAYGNLPDIYRQYINEAYGNPDTSMFAYPEATLAKLGGLGDIVKGYYDTIRPELLADWQSNQRPLVEEQYAGPGYWGTDRAAAVSKSQDDLTRQLALQEASGYAQAREKGTLLDTQARLGIDTAKMAYLADMMKSKNSMLATGLTNVASARSNALSGLLSQEPNMAATVAALSRKFVEPVMNPEYVAAANLATSLLGTPAFSTAGWVNPSTNEWSNLLGAAGSTVGNILAKNLPSLSAPITPTTISSNNWDSSLANNAYYNTTNPYTGESSIGNSYTDSYWNDYLSQLNSGGYSGNNPLNYTTNWSDFAE